MLNLQSPGEPRLLFFFSLQIRRRRCCLQVKEQRPRKEAVTWEQMLDLGGRGLRRQELIAAEGIY